MKNVAVVDYGMGNVDSVVRALEDCGANVSLTAVESEILHASHVVLPGVGAFCDGMSHLIARGLHTVLRSVAEQGVPLLGICLGMQLLASEGTEGGVADGLGLLDAEIVRLAPTDPDVRIPHVGWNSVRRRRHGVLLTDIQDERDFYFVHSFHMVCHDPADVVAVTPYCGEFTSVVERGNIFGTQFHPEKSQRAGFSLLRSFLAR